MDLSSNSLRVRIPDGTEGDIATSRNVLKWKSITEDEIIQIPVLFVSGNAGDSERLDLFMKRNMRLLDYYKQFMGDTLRNQRLISGTGADGSFQELNDGAQPVSDDIASGIVESIPIHHGAMKSNMRTFKGGGLVHFFQDC